MSCPEEHPSLHGLDARCRDRGAPAGRRRALRVHRPPLLPEVVRGGPRAHHPYRFPRAGPGSPHRDGDLAVHPLSQSGLRRSGLHRHPAGRVPLCGQSDAWARRRGRSAQRSRLGACHPPRHEAGWVAAAVHARPRVHQAERPGRRCPDRLPQGPASGGSRADAQSDRSGRSGALCQGRRRPGPGGADRSTRRAPARGARRRHGGVRPLSHRRRWLPGMPRPGVVRRARPRGASRLEAGGEHHPGGDRALHGDRLLPRPPRGEAPGGRPDRLVHAFRVHQGSHRRRDPGAMALSADVPSRPFGGR